MSGIKLPPVERPNGKPYRPRKISHAFLGNEDELMGIVIFGTHDKEFAQRRAEEPLLDLEREFYDGFRLEIQDDGELVWFDRCLAGFEDDHPVYGYAPNSATGRAGVKFMVDEVEVSS